MWHKAETIGTQLGSNSLFGRNLSSALSLITITQGRIDLAIQHVEKEKKYPVKDSRIP